MKPILILALWLYGIAYSVAQNGAYKVLDFIVEEAAVGAQGDSTINKSYYKFLMLNEQKAIDLSSYGNRACEYEVLSGSDEKVILTYSQPTKLTGKGMCAAGTERGIILIELNGATVQKTQRFLTESCYFTIDQLKREQAGNIITITCEPLSSPNPYQLIIDKQKMTVTKTEL